MVETYVPDHLLAEWFIKSLLPSITEDVAKGGVVTEEQFIARAQYLDLIYTQSGTLYDKIPNAPKLEFFIPPPPKSNRDSHAGDGVIGTSSTQTAKAPSGKELVVSSKKPNDKLLASEVNVVSSDKGKEPKQPRNKKKGKNKKKKQEDSTPEKSFGNPARQRKPPPHFPCLICNEGYYTRDCPH